MLTPSKLTTIKWVGPNTVMIEIERNSARLYLTKNEAIDLIDAVNMFTEAYPESFSIDTINYTDDWEWPDTDG
jgi:hypothetical protein